MPTKSKYTFRCPSCGGSVGTDIKPTAPPYCYNEESSHSNRGKRMEFMPSLSKEKKEPQYANSK